LGKSRLEKDINLAVRKYPKLKHIKEKKFGHCLYGTIDITGVNGEVYDSFKVKLVFIGKYPFQLPFLFDIGNRIPHSEERHISKSGICCVCSKREQDVRQQKGIRVLEFLNEYVIPFYANQLYFEQEKEWVNGDYKHFDEGVLQDYQELTGIEDSNAIVNCITDARKCRAGRNESCPCGSELKYKNCHRVLYDEIKKLSNDRVLEDIETLNSL